jgi:O-antigen ligase
MAAVQTYALGNQFGKSFPGLEDERFTSFCSPQLFGAFLLATMSILFVTSRQSIWAVCIHGFGGFSGIVLCGSRYVFLGSLVLVLIVVVSHVVRQPTAQKHAARVIAGMAGLVVGTFLLAGVLYADQENRISQLVATVLEGESPLDNIGTLVWRRAVYDQTWTALAHRGPAELAIGSGTSSGALAVIGWDRRYLETSIDANRVVHNELLRVIFEWGFTGLALFVAFLVYMIRLFFRLAVRNRIMPAYAFLALLPTVILGCCSENILAGSASPAGVGFLLSMMYGICYEHRRIAQTLAPA